jgi:hypothetical protein
MKAMREFSSLCLLFNNDYLPTFEKIKKQSDAIKSNNAPVQGGHQQDMRSDFSGAGSRPKSI